MPTTVPNRTLVAFAFAFAFAFALALLALALAGCGGAQARKAKHLAKGQAYLSAENYEKARVEFQNALQISPVDPEARFENGVVDEKLQKVREAAQFYQGTIDVSPDHVGARTNLARLYLFAGAPDKTLELVGPALEQHPDNAQLLTLRAAAKVQKKDLSAGQADAERAVQLDPQNQDAVSALAGIYVSSNVTEKAQVLLEESVKKIPSTVELRLALAQVYAGEKRRDDAERILVELVGLQPSEKAHRIRLAQFYAHQNQNDAAEKVLREAIKGMPKDRDLKFSLVDFLATQRSAETAEKELQGMIAQDPKDFELKFALAKFYAGNRQPERAEKIYRDVIETEKLDAAGIVARNRLAHLRAQANDVPGTEVLIGQVLAKSPRDNDALILRADIAMARKEPKAAIADLRTVMRDQPNSVGVLRTLARAHVENGEPAIAEETIRRALEANSTDAGLRLDLAQLLGQMGKAEQSKALLSDLVKEQPDNIQALDSLFRVSASSKDFDTAAAAARSLVAAQPKAAMGYFYQGVLAEETKHVDDAVRWYRQAEDLQPDGIEPLQAEVRLLIASKRIPEAVRRLDERIEKDQKGGLAADMKGELLLTQRDFDGAQAAFKLAIRRAPTWFNPYRGLAAVQIAANDSEGALATLRSAEAAVAQPDQARLEIAAYFERIGKPEDAMQEYQLIVSGNPQSDVAANNLAMLLVTYAKDAASLDRAKTLSARFADSPNPAYLDTYGWVLFKHGEAAASVPVLERVISKAPAAPVVLYHLGMAQSQAGKTEQARDNLTRAVNSGTKFRGLDEAKATLDTLAKLPAVAASKT